MTCPICAQPEMRAEIDVCPICGQPGANSELDELAHAWIEDYRDREEHERVFGTSTPKVIAQ